MSDDKKPAASPDAKPKADARMDAGGRAASGTKAEQPPRPDKTQHRPGQRVAINTEQFTEDNTSINSTREED